MPPELESRFLRRAAFPLWPFVAKALAWLAVTYFASRRLSEQAFGIIVVSVLVFAIPVALAGAYSAAVNQVRRLSHFKEGGWAYAVLSRRFFGTLIWLAWALLTSFVMLLQFSTYSGLEWLALAMSIPVFWVVHSWSHGILSSELKKPYLATSFAIGCARPIAPLVVLAIYLGLVWAFGTAESYGSLTEALAARRVGVVEGGSSALVELALRLITFADGSKAYLAGRFSGFAWFIPFVLMALGAYVVFFNATATFSCFAIPPTEYRRVFGPITEIEVPGPLRAGRVALIAALATFVALFVYVPIFAQVEGFVRRHPEVVATIKTLERRVEQIDKDYYQPGTIERIGAAKAVFLSKLDVSRATLEAQVDRAFAQIEGNVDGYLDWYYSLSAEYTRLVKLLSGQIEGYMEEKLSVYLQKGDPSGEIKRGIEAAIATHQGALDDYRRTVKEILDSNRVAVDNARPIVSGYVSLSDVLAMPIQADLMAFNERVAGGAVAAGIGAVVTGKIVSKTIFKAAAKAVAKVVVAKAGGAAAGAATGAATCASRRARTDPRSTNAAAPRQRWPSISKRRSARRPPMRAWPRSSAI